MYNKSSTVALAAGRDGERPVIVLADGREHENWDMTKNGYVQVNEVPYWTRAVEAVYAGGERFAYHAWERED